MMPEQITAQALRAGDLVQISAQHWLDIPLYWHRWRIESVSIDLISKFVFEAASLSLRRMEV